MLRKIKIKMKRLRLMRGIFFVRFIVCELVKFLSLLVCWEFLFMIKRFSKLWFWWYDTQFFHFLLTYKETDWVIYEMWERNNAITNLPPPNFALTPGIGSCVVEGTKESSISRDFMLPTKSEVPFLSTFSGSNSQTCVVKIEVRKKFRTANEFFFRRFGFLTWEWTPSCCKFEGSLI